MFLIRKGVLMGSTWGRDEKYCGTGSITSSDIQVICDESKKINFAYEELYIYTFGVKEDLILIFCRNGGYDSIEVYENSFLCGSKKISDIPNLYEFLNVLYAEQKIGGIKTFKFLLDLTDSWHTY